MNSTTIQLPYVKNGFPFTVYYEIDRFIKEVLIDREYKPLLDMIDSIRDRTDLVVIDLGCNIGTFSLSIYDYVSHIYAIDIGKRNIEIFNETLIQNIFSRISTHQIAIAGEEKTVQLGYDINSTLGDINIYGQGQSVSAITLAQFIEYNKINIIDVLKIDVEGAETEIFNAKDFPKVASKIRSIIGEIHGGSDIQTTLMGNGYKYNQYGPHFIAINQYAYTTTNQEPSSTTTDI